MIKRIIPNTFLSAAIIASGGIGAVGGDAYAQSTDSSSHDVVNQKVETEDTSTSDYQNHYVDVKGEKIYVNAVIKNPKFKTLILVHGAGSQADSWGFVTSKFTGNFNYIALDLPGHYRSGGEARTSIDDDADFINHFVKAIQKKYHLKNDFTYVGHSLGGAIGIEVGTRNYDWLKSLVLVTTSSDFTHVLTPEFLENLKNGQMDLSFYKNGFSPATPPAYYDALVSRLGTVSIETTYKDFYSTSSFNDTKKLHKIHKKTLIISANDDIIMPPNASQILHDGIKHSTWVKVPNAGHFVIMEQPTAVANAIQDFVDQKK